MAENQTVAETGEVKPSFGKRFLAGVKEWFRKSIVKLKRRPMNIAFFVLIISSLMFMVMLGSISQAGIKYSASGVPISIFVNTLFSILVLLLFMYAFPKRAKKPNIVMLVLCFAFMAVLIALDILLYVRWTTALDADRIILTDEQLEVFISYVTKAISAVLAHAVIVAIAALLTATYPLYGKLINMINTKKVVESTEIKGEIDTSEEV